MAQTKRKRQTKHRGNAAGVVESRGRPGSKPTDEARKQRADAAKGTGKGAKKTKEQVRQERLDRKPTWSSAATRGGLAAAVFLLALLFIFKRPAGVAISIALFVLVFYVVLGYGMDSFIYRRRMARKAKVRS